MWVDRTGARRGALLLCVGLVLLLTTPLLGSGFSSTPDCSALNDPETARECVSSGAQAIDRRGFVIVGVVVLALGVFACGGLLMARARGRVVDIAEAATLLEIDVDGVRSLVENGDLASFTTDGRTYFEAANVEKRVSVGTGMLSNG
jgi:hypothetical protein